ncbi:MAG TPA: T9SS type A sorting domain-containing protein, partial [Bacteroidia bacterium]
LFPNPASSEITLSIEGEDLSNYQIDILNILGAIQPIQIQNSKISIASLAAGVYWVSARSKNGNLHLSAKIIKY